MFYTYHRDYGFFILALKHLKVVVHLLIRYMYMHNSHHLLAVTWTLKQQSQLTA